MTSNSGNTPSPTSRKLEEDDNIENMTGNVPDLSNMNKGSIFKNGARERNMTPTPQVQVEFCETVPKSEN
jgi:hypothetical protein